jgi:hypothetical protein
MSVIFQDLQDKHNKLNGTRVGDPSILHGLLDALKQHREPFLFELNADGGDTLTIGIGADVGCVQHTGSEGMPPYLMALNETVADDEGFVEFLAGGTPTPIPRKYCLPMSVVEAIAAEFVATGNRSSAVAWEGI